MTYRKDDDSEYPRTARPRVHVPGSAAAGRLLPGWGPTI